MRDFEQNFRRDCFAFLSEVDTYLNTEEGLQGGLTGDPDFLTIYDLEFNPLKQLTHEQTKHLYELWFYNEEVDRPDRRAWVYELEQIIHGS